MERIVAPEQDREAMEKWTVAGLGIAVECPRGLLRQVASLAMAGFARSPAGGPEVGGVLYGSRTARLVSILAYEPIECEHASGPAFELSERDEAGLAAGLREKRTLGDEPESPALIPVGWFHTEYWASSPAKADVGLHDRHFPERWQVVMVLQRQKSQPVRIASFVRDRGNSAHGFKPIHDGTIDLESRSPAADMVIEAAVAIPAGASAASGTRSDESTPPARAVAEAAAVTMPADESAASGARPDEPAPPALAVAEAAPVAMPADESAASGAHSDEPAPPALAVAEAAPVAMMADESAASGARADESAPSALAVAEAAPVAMPAAASPAPPALAVAEAAPVAMPTDESAASRTHSDEPAPPALAVAEAAPVAMPADESAAFGAHSDESAPPALAVTDGAPVAMAAGASTAPGAQTEETAPQVLALPEASPVATAAGASTASQAHTGELAPHTLAPPETQPYEMTQAVSAPPEPAQDKASPYLAASEPVPLPGPAGLMPDEAIPLLLAGIREGSGILLVQCGLGSQRELMIALGDALQKAAVEFALLIDPPATVEQFLKMIVDDLNLACRRPLRKDRMAALREFLQHRSEKGLTTVLIVNQWDRLTLEVLAEIGYLDDLSGRGGKLLHTILCGAPELDGKIKSPKFEARIQLRCVVGD